MPDCELVPSASALAASLCAYTCARVFPDHLIIYLTAAAQRGNPHLATKMLSASYLARRTSTPDTFHPSTLPLTSGASSPAPWKHAGPARSSSEASERGLESLESLLPLPGVALLQSGVAVRSCSAEPERGLELQVRTGVAARSCSEPRRW